MNPWYCAWKGKQSNTHTGSFVEGELALNTEAPISSGILGQGLLGFPLKNLTKSNTTITVGRVLIA